MPRFEILSNGTVVGNSDLEHGDPPIGVAAGRFIPLPQYEGIRPAVVAARSSIQTHLALTVRTADGRLIPAAGMQINDYSVELGPEGIEVEVYAIGYPLYEELFPGRHAEYVSSFRKRSKAC